MLRAKRFIVVLCAHAALVGRGQGASECVQRDGVATCPKPPLRESLEEDAVQDPALGLVQRALWYKTREVRLGDAAAGANLTAFAGASAAEHSPCHRRVVEAHPLPMTPLGRAEIEAFRTLGLLAPHPQCPKNEVNFISIMPNHTIEEKNQVAKLIVLAWTTLCAGAILWSVISVLCVPRKRDWENQMTQRKLNLADEDAAFKKGFFYWLSLAWVDGLTGRYGKCLHAVVNDCEIVENRNDEEYTPYVVFKKHWQEQVALKGVEEASISWALFKTVGLRATASLVFFVLVELIFSMVGMVVALDRFLTYLEFLADDYQSGAEVSLLEPTLVIVIALFGVPMIYRSSSVMAALLDGYYCNMCAAGLASIVFEKALSLPAGAAPDEEDDDPAPAGGPMQSTQDEKMENQKKPSVIQILNVDIIEMWGSLLKLMLCTILSPIVAIVLFVMLVQQIHMAGVFGFLYVIPCMIATIIAQVTMIRFWMRYQGYQDVRLKSLTETILHIRTIKSLAWESLSFKRLNDARIFELTSNQKTITLGGLVMSFLHTTPWFSMLIALYALLKLNGGIAAHQIIVIQRIMMSLLTALGMVAQGLRKFAQAPNSFRRIRAYLAQPDRAPNVVRPPSSSLPNAPAVRVQGTFTFGEGKPPTLYDMDVAIPRGELVAVIGEVASGKSAFLNTIIGELYPVGSAHVEAPASGTNLAFCAQVPWIFEGTLRENVVMRAAFDDERYHKALYAAALMPDLQILPGGDQVTIGSYGVRLSGGQRARTALARAAYMQQAEVVLADDPFASVDVPTGQHLLDELFLGPLMQGRTRIVVTQPSQRLRKFDRILLLKDGRVAVSGPPAEVMESKDYQRLLADNDSGSTDGSEGNAEDAPGGRKSKLPNVKSQNSLQATSLREVEAQEHVTWETCKWWIQAAGYGNLALFAGLVVSQRMLMLRESLMLASWIDAKLAGPVDDMWFIKTTAVYVIMCCLVIWAVSWAAARVTISAATKMHQTVIYAILRAPIDKFFDKQPVGRLINRLSYDMRQVDDYIPLAAVTLMMFCFGFCVQQSFIISSMPTKICLASIPFYLVVGLFIFLYRGTCVPLVFHSKFALSTLQDMQAVVLTCCVSIRANGMFDDFMMRYNHQSASIIRCQYLIHYVCKAWVQARVFLCFSTLTCIFALGGVWSAMPMGVLATVVSLSFEQMVEFENISTVFTQFLNILNALQRLTNYFRIPQEAPATLPNDPTVRLRTKMERANMLRLEIRRAAEAEACLEGAGVKGTGGCCTPLVLCLKGTPVLQASSDGLALEPLPGIKLEEVFPGCADLKSMGGVFYHIVAVNSLTRDAERMAEELCNPPSMVWLDLWHSTYAPGIQITVEDLTAGYGNDKSVLDNLRIEIPPRTKVGFAGKTGCGKSTTLLCFLRILEPRGGRIMLGHLDSGKIGLNALRAMVGLVPQDPTVFGGSWRYNIDPFNEFPDGRIWEALQCVQLLPYIRTLPGGIDSEISKDGANISFGQRQLLSLARMVIRQPPVLLLDECTSALDPSTQQTAQTTLLNDFPMSTIIAIAHRVETILDFDRIVVLDKGSLAEQGTVKEVLEIEDGIFREMVEGALGASNSRARSKDSA